jgi:uncharacterized protein (TIGR02231 family)
LAQATHITFYEDRARVEREAAVSLTEGAQTICLRGPGLVIDDSSLTLETDSPDVELITWRVRRVASVTRHEGELAERQKQCGDANLKAREASYALSRVRLQHEHLLGAYGAQLEQGERLRIEAFEDWSAALNELEQQLDARRAELHEAERTLERAQLQLGQANARLEVARLETPQLEAHVELQLRATRAHEARVKMSYATPCAAWRPAHRAALDVSSSAGDQPSATLTMTTIATAWQATGERWEQVECSFSTARPTQAAAPPKVQDDVLYTRPKTELERQQVTVEARDVTIQATGPQQSGSQADDLPGVDDGGEPLLFKALSRVTFVSDGAPQLIELETTSMEARVELVAMPELTPVAHMRARARWSGAAPLLAGPVTLLRAGAIVGQAQLKFVAPGAALELGFGPDNALRLKREVKQEHSVRGMMRRNYLEREVSIYLSNLSDQPRTVELIERVPVSEIEDVHVKLSEQNPAPADRDGFIRTTIKLPARKYQTTTIQYSLDYGSNVNLRL